MVPLPRLSGQAGWFPGTPGSPVLPGGVARSTLEPLREHPSMCRKLISTVLLAFTLFFVVGAFAQKSKKEDASISGVVLDATGKPVSAAAVSCQSSAGLHPRIVHTDAKGHYLITGLKQDSYDLRATSNGAYSDWEKNIPLRKGQAKDITLRLLNGNTALSGILPAKKKD